MSAKKKTTSENQKPLKVGSRVRCTDDGIEGRISWANATSVKIKWDDGEEVTWKRDSLADRPITIIEETEASEPASQPELPVADESTPLEPTQVEGTAEQFVEPPAISEPTNGSETDLAAQTEKPEQSAQHEKPAAQCQEAQPDQQPAVDAPVATEVQASAPAKAKRHRKTKATDDKPKEKKLSALDAAARVLEETGEAMTCVELVEAMASKGYWSSPNGKTPSATLYSAILRELQTKGDQARFIKADRGKFAFRKVV